MQSVSICWFRKDLRIQDNPALFYSLQDNNTLPIFIFPSKSSFFSEDSAGKEWLFACLTSLNQSLKNTLCFFEETALHTFSTLLSMYPIAHVYCNRCYEPEELLIEKKVRDFLFSHNIPLTVFQSNLLIEPLSILKKDLSSYKLFTPFYKKALSIFHKPLLFSIKESDLSNLFLDHKPTPQKNLFKKTSTPSHFSFIHNLEACEKAALKTYTTFLDETIHKYSSKRDFPAEVSTSKLSPYLHFGLLSPHRIFYLLNNRPYDNNVESFLRELLWRDFSYYLLYHNPSYPTKSQKSKLQKYPWKQDEELFLFWKRGLTGFPFVDAGMRELFSTGFMHNRCRMVTSSFLVKNLQIDWRKGASWFLHRLVDADIASNSINWQWVAGTGLDSNPFFRIFNPVLQGKKFDPNGQYIRQFVPELKQLPTRYLFSPWDAPEEELRKANVHLGKTYPFPVVNYSISRQETLSVYRSLL